MKSWFLAGSHAPKSMSKVLTAVSPTTGKRVVT